MGFFAFLQTKKAIPEVLGQESSPNPGKKGPGLLVLEVCFSRPA